MFFGQKLLWMKVFENYDFRSKKIRILTNFIFTNFFGQKLKVLAKKMGKNKKKIGKNSYFILTKISIFDFNFNFWPS